MKTSIALFVLATLASGSVSAQELDSASSSTDYRARTVYFLLADRFHPQEPYNPYVDPEHPFANNNVNCFAIFCDQDEQYRKYWGGDIQGIIQKLDYLNDLGISALWVTPLMENVRAYVPSTGYGTGYHGYWVQNYYRVNEHFGSWADVNDLSQQLHAKGMRYIQDITLNHSNPYDNHVNGRLFESEASDHIFIDSYDNDFDPSSGLRYYKHNEGDQRCIDATNLADYDWSYWQLHHCLLADLSGYNQQDPAMANYLLGAGKTWIDNGVDDWRLDAVKFPFPEFIANFTRTMRNYSASLNKPLPYIVGEWSHGGVGDAKSLKFANSYNVFGTNILDFSLSLVLNQFIGGDYEVGSDKITAFDLDNQLHLRIQAFQGRDTWQGTFIDNHDQIRTMVRLQKLSLNDETERERRMDLASVLLMTVRGVPIIFYGDEQYLAHYNDGNTTDPQYVNTGNDDPWNRPGLKTFDETTPAFQIIHTLAALRKQSPAIWKGSYITAYVNKDVLMFERRYGGEVVLVAVNRGDDTTIKLNGKLGIAPGSYTGLLEHASDVNKGNYISVTSGDWTLHLNKLSALVIRP